MEWMMHVKYVCVGTHWKEILVENFTLDSEFQFWKLSTEFCVSLWKVPVWHKSCNTQQKNVFFSYLIWYHDQRVLVLWQKVKQAPETKSILFWQYFRIPLVIVLFGSERPTEVVHVLFNKTAWYHLHGGHTVGDRSALGETWNKTAIA